MKVIIFILMTVEVKPGGVRSPRRPVLNLESAGVSRSWLRGVHAPCECSGGKSPTDGSVIDLAIETGMIERRQMSEDRKRANLW